MEYAHIHIGFLGQHKIANLSELLDQKRVGVNTVKGGPGWRGKVVETRWDYEKGVLHVKVQIEGR